MNNKIEIICLRLINNLKKRKEHYLTEDDFKFFSDKKEIYWKNIANYLINNYNFVPCILELEEGEPFFTQIDETIEPDWNNWEVQNGIQEWAFIAPNEELGGLMKFSKEDFNNILN